MHATRSLLTVAVLATSLWSIGEARIVPPAQLSTTAPVAPTCRLTLDSLDAKLRRNYAGFLLEVRGARRAAYDSMLTRQRAAADAAVRPDCYGALEGYARWFDDPHVFVYQFAEPDSNEAALRLRSLRHVSLTESQARAYFARERRTLDPIEGIWFDGPTRMAVVRDSAGPRGAFVGVLLAADTVGWPAGSVRARFTRRADGAFTTELATRNFGARSLTTTLHKRTVMRMSPGMWGKAEPLLVADTGLIDTVNVHAPRVSVRDRAVVFSIPSHDPQYLARFDSLVRASEAAIRRTGLLIIDLRGNEGGASFVTRALHPFIASRVSRPTPFDSGNAVVLSSPAQIAYARRFTGTDTSAFVRSLISRMESHPGELVPIYETPPPEQPDSVLDGSWRVVIMVDRGTVSASEVLVLRGLRSTRTTVVGMPTAGALDYQSTQIVLLGTGERRWGLGYPTITAHADLPRRGMRGKGIAPDVRLDWTGIADPIAEMERRYARKPQ